MPSHSHISFIEGMGGGAAGLGDSVVVKSQCLSWCQDDGCLTGKCFQESGALCPLFFSRAAEKVAAPCAPALGLFMLIHLPTPALLLDPLKFVILV